jgi:hypothetical protein
MRFARVSLFALLVLAAAATGSADTVRVSADRALVWTHPSGVSVVVTQLRKDMVVDVVRREGQWYLIVLPAGALGSPVRTGYVHATQVVIESVGPQSFQAALGARAGAPAPQRKPTGFFNIDAVRRSNPDDLTRSFTSFTESFAEPGTIAANYGASAGWALGLMGGQAVWRSIGAEVGVDYYLRKQSAAVDARIPHPFFFDQPRSATFETGTVSGHEAAIHIGGAWIPPAFGPVRVLAYGGPTIFRVSQVVVTGLTLDDQYPHDTVAITGVTTAERKGTVFGFHAGADVSYFFTRSVGVGAGVRYSHATLEFARDPDATSTGIAGATGAVAGARFRF